VCVYNLSFDRRFSASVRGKILKKGCLIALGIPTALVLWVIALFWFEFYNIHVRYRLTVEVQDGDQIKTGSSVIEALYDIQPAWSWSGPGNTTRVIGYAPTVDLGDKGLLFLTFANATRSPQEIIERNNFVFCAANDVYCLPFEAYGERGTGVATHFYDRKAPLEALIRKSGPRDVPFAALTKLSRFRNDDDPRLLVHVSPYNLAATFGPGVELKRVVLQLTDDPITPPPEIWPQWLTIKHRNTMLRGYEAD
jgi:hypothetical protein